MSKGKEEHSDQPLKGMRILITRAKEQAQELSSKIVQLGGEAIEFPVIRMVPPAIQEELDRSLFSIDQFTWIVLTSTNGVTFFFQRFRELNLDVQKLRRVKFAAVGPKTAQEIEKEGFSVSCIPPTSYTNEGLLEAIIPILQKGDKILLPRSNIARAILPTELKALGYDVVEVDLYETIANQREAKKLIDLFYNKQVDIITFTSPSTVKNFLACFHLENQPHDLTDDLSLGSDPMSLLKGVGIASIGPITTKTAIELGLDVDEEAKSYTIDGLIDVLIDMGGKSR